MTESKKGDKTHFGKWKDTIPWWVKSTTLCNQILIPVYLMVVGTAFLATSEDFGDLVMNSTGLWFIMQLDEGFVGQYALDVVKPFVDAIKMVSVVYMDMLEKETTEGEISRDKVHYDNKKQIAESQRLNDNYLALTDRFKEQLKEGTEEDVNVKEACLSLLKVNDEMLCMVEENANKILGNAEVSCYDEEVMEVLKAFQGVQDDLEADVINCNGHLFGSLQLDIKWSSGRMRNLFVMLEFLMPFFAFFVTVLILWSVTVSFKGSPQEVKTLSCTSNQKLVKMDCASDW